MRRRMEPDYPAQGGLEVGRGSFLHALEASMARSISPLFVVVALSQAVAGCDSRDVPTLPSGTAQPEVQVSVQPLVWSGNVEFVYQWSGGPASRISVSHSSGNGAVVWEVVHEGGGINAPVFHGSSPPGAVATVWDIARLVPGAGIHYRVQVTLRDGRTGDAEFTT